MTMLEPDNMLLYAALALVLGGAVYTDIRRQRIPNLLTIGGAVAGMALQTRSAGLAGLMDSALGLGAGLIILLPLYLRGGMGAGDVKLMAAVGALLGLEQGLLATALTLVVGGVFGLVILVWRRGLSALLRRYLGMLRVLWVTGILDYAAPAPGEAAALRFPYALAIGLGTLAAVLWLRI